MAHKDRLGRLRQRLCWPFVAFSEPLRPHAGKGCNFRDGYARAKPCLALPSLRSRGRWKTLAPAAGKPAGFLNKNTMGDFARFGFRRACARELLREAYG